jgi:hypothetical protein
MMMKKLILSILLICSGFWRALSQVNCFEDEKVLLTHILVPTGPIPTAFDPNGVYPYISFCETSARPVPVKYRLIILENNHIKVTICPDSILSPAAFKSAFRFHIRPRKTKWCSIK